MSLDQTILNVLEKDGEIDSLGLASDQSVDHQKLIGAIKSLLALPGEYIKVFITPLQFTRLSANNKQKV